MNKHYSRTAVRTSRAQPRLLGVAIASALAAVASGSAQAFDFSFGDGFTGNLDTTLTYGVSQRIQGQDGNLIGKAYFNPVIGQQPNAVQRTARGRFSVNSDDGNLNYDSGDLFSNAIKATTELKLNYGQDWGAFFRASYFYDFENVGRDELSDEALKKVGKQFKLLDAFVFHNFEMGDVTGTIRLGSQVLSWGESTFIQNGINVVNPVDVSKLRVAGAELKEAFLPVPMVYLNFTFNDAFSIEGFYQTEYQQTDPDPVGTYFSTNDFATLGGRYAMLGFGLAPQPVINPDLYYDVCYNPAGGAVGYNLSDTGLPAPLVQAGCNAAIPRVENVMPKSQGQYGVGIHYFAEWLNNTEFTLYAMNYHSRLPIISGHAIRNASVTSADVFVEYPEDIRLFGLSFNTQLEESGIALQGEVSYRPNAPLQLDDVEQLFLGLSPLNALIPAPYNRFISQLGTATPGQELQGYVRHKVGQWQFTLTKVIPQVMGSDQMALVGEFGGTKIYDLPEGDLLRYNGDGTDTGGGPDVLTGAGRNPQTQVKGFPTEYSWGYRVAVRMDYNSVWGTAFNMSPRVAFNHDVNGISPGPGGNFIEGRRSMTLGVETTYQNQWSGDLSYTRFMGAEKLNLIHDRDFVSATIKYSF